MHPDDVPALAKILAEDVESRRTVRRMVGRKIVEVEVPRPKNFAVSVYGKDEPVNVTADGYEVNDSVLTFTLKGEEVVSFIASNVEYIWRVDA